MKQNNIIIAFIVILIAIISGCAGWPVYSTPAFQGRIIDAETKEPIEKAVAVVLYDKKMLIGGPGGPNSYVYHAKERLTDSKGEFLFPSYFSIHLISKGDGVSFIFYKPGYMASYGPIEISYQLTEKYFSAGKVGEELEIEGGTVEQGNWIKWKGPLGIVELKRAKTYEERRRTRPSKGGLEEMELPLFFGIIEEEYRFLYK